MSDLYEPDTGAAYYRSRDPIKNLKIRVRIERVTSASIVPQAVIEQENGQVEMQDFRQKTLSMGQKDIEDHTFLWQEKVFSQRELEFYSLESNCLDVIDKKYNREVLALREKDLPTHRLFSYVSDDKYTNQNVNVQYMTTSPNETQSLLAQRAGHVRRRRLMGKRMRDSENAIVPKINIVEQEPTEEAMKRNHLISTPEQTMYIMADLSPKDRDGTEEDEYVLCTVKVDGNGVISINPDFNKGRQKPYRIETSSMGRDVFEYTLEHVSKQMNRLEQDRERKMYRELYSRHSEFLTACVGHEFEMPPPNILRVLTYGEIMSAKNFEYDDLYVHYFVELPRNWRADHSQQLSGVTHTCQTRTEERDNIANFSFPFNFEVFYKNDTVNENNTDLLPHWPQLFIEVLSLDSWQRYRTEGYGYLTLPSTPGVHTLEVNCWRPLGNSLSANLRRFFIGGSPEIEDPTYCNVPSTFEGRHLSRFGFKTETTGIVKVKLNIIHQSRAFLESTTSKKKVGSLMDRLGATAAQLNILNVLDAFKRARERMIAARENVVKDMKGMTLTETIGAKEFEFEKGDS